jgi:hypothetical protein
MSVYKLKKGKKHYWKTPLKKKGSKKFEDRLIENEELIKCDEWELGGAIDKFILLEDEEIPQKPDLGLVVVNVGKGKYDVVNERTEKKINDEPMSLKEANNLATGETKLSEKPESSLTKKNDKKR